MLHWRPHRPTLHSRRSCPPNQPPFRRDARAGDHPRNRTADHQSSPCWEVWKQPRLPTHSSRFGAQPRVPCSPPEKPAGQPWKPKCAPTPEPPEPGWEPGQSGRCLPRVSAQPLRLPRAMRRSQTIRSPFAILQKATEPSIQQIQRPIHPRRRVTPLFPVATLFPGIGALFGHPRDRVTGVLRPREPVRAAAESGWQATPPTEVLWRKNLPCPTSPADWQAAEQRPRDPGFRKIEQIALGSLQIRRFSGPQLSTIQSGAFALNPCLANIRQQSTQAIRIANSGELLQRRRGRTDYRLCFLDHDDLSKNLIINNLQTTREEHPKEFLQRSHPRPRSALGERIPK